MTTSLTRYIDPEESMAAQTNGTDIPHVLTVMAQRYIGEHPPHGPVYRVTRASEIRKLDNHSYSFPIDRMFPEMRADQRVYAWAKLWIEEPHEFIFLLRCFGPVRLFHNGEQRFGSALEEEAEGAQSLKLKIGLVRGWNHFVLELGRRADGSSGAEFGTGNRKNKPYAFLAPSLEREGEEGWIHTAPMEGPLVPIPAAAQAEAAAGTGSWLPLRASGNPGEGRLERLYGLLPGMKAISWTSVRVDPAMTGPVTVSGTAYGPVTFVWNGHTVYETAGAGTFSFNLEACRRSGSLVAYSTCGDEGWGFGLLGDLTNAALFAPVKVHGYAGEWLHLGPLAADSTVRAETYMRMDTVASGPAGEVFWTTDEPGAYVRPFLENELFGRWNYPLGVTLNGLLETSRLLARADIAEYVTRHVEFATSTYAYSLWDRKHFGAAGLNNQLSHIDSLDDCGSFGALAILADRQRQLTGARAVAEDIADYIMNVQDRLEDGTLYRRIGVSPSMHNTMWCDDMYMSVPFLCRYSELSGDSQYVEEASRQMLLYKKYLYMPQRQIMSHVYDVGSGKPSLTTWGRGNGWVFFSLAVLLQALPKGHANYKGILRFYQELAEGYLRLQGKNGLWHQVLTDPESYEEASCTSMFMYGFALGVRHGWLPEPQVYTKAVIAGWIGLCSRAIDKRGNLYGVCKGSSWSYSNAYYKHDLGWNLNDTHGIGIVLLAGIETQAMMNSLGMTI
ncbi:glycoside hydrolase family 105 protein [Paenibacillus sp. GCM10023248]|uniref:glycoside hydrolase family 88/105 protein n=1 Tax=unclassified Paenibacillus TaxID=185978 RepID=UPI0023780C77|nr:glycoside hydrolase family 88 protein [Paenibacillus sp. MAHUQ-63]MDD9271615.1 glycoside hydrolase family 88 protein [Paenibacillus sp. MAHUQ-63]